MSQLNDLMENKKKMNFILQSLSRNEKFLLLGFDSLILSGLWFSQSTFLSLIEIFGTLHKNKII